MYLRVRRRFVWKLKSVKSIGSEFASSKTSGEDSEGGSMKRAKQCKYTTTTTTTWQGTTVHHEIVLTTSRSSHCLTAMTTQEFCRYHLTNTPQRGNEATQPPDDKTAQ